MEVAVLGPVEVRHDGAPVEVRRGHTRALLALLALRSPDVVAADVLIDRLWGDDLPENPANALQLQVSSLRRALGAVPGGRDAVVTEAGGYRLGIGPDDLDVRRFEALADRAGRTDARPDERLALLDEARALWRGDPLPEIAGHPDVAGEVTRLGELRVRIEELRVDALIELGRTTEAIGDLRPLVADFPLHERFHAQLMLCLYRAGRQSEALRAFQEVRSHLLEELGLDVGPELQALEGQILAQDPRLGAPTASPAATRTAELRPTPPSAPLTSLVGRDRDVDHVEELVAHHRLVTLTGPGGTGKTRLAVEVARRRADASDAVFFVDLGSASPDEDLPRAVADRLRVSTSVDGEVTRDLVAALPEVRGLLVLDTCEHVVDQVAPLVEAVVSAAAGVTVLATSRRPLGVPGEVTRAVSPLAVPPDDAPPEVAAATTAVQLFRQRARSVRADFEIAPDDVGDVIAICRAVDGLPLAIELAAGHVDVLGPAAIRDRLARRFDLVSGHTAGPERHRALRATIDWSVDLLTADERALLFRLAVFAGSFDLDAAAAVSELDDPLPLLATLVRQSLVSVDGDGRYRLLDSVRAHVGDLARAGPDDRTALADRHAALFVDRARAADREVRGPDQQSVVERMERDLPDHRAALMWLAGRPDGDAFGELASSLSWMWAVHGNTAEADQWLTRALERELTGRVRTKVLLAASMIAAPAGELERSAELSRAAADLAAEADLPVHRATALLNSGVATWALGDLVSSAADLDEALRLFEETGRRRGIALTAMNRARTALDADDLPLAAELLDRAATIADDGGDPQLTSLILHQRARLALHRGRLDAAERLAAIALEQAEALAHHETIAASLRVLGSVRLDRGDPTGAGAIHRRALEVATDARHAGATIEAIEALAAVAMAEGAEALAATMLASAEAERRRRRIPLPASEARRRDGLHGAPSDDDGALPFDVVVADQLETGR